MYVDQCTTNVLEMLMVNFLGDAFAKAEYLTTACKKKGLIHCRKYVQVLGRIIAYGYIKKSGTLSSNHYSSLWNISSS